MPRIIRRVKSQLIGKPVGDRSRPDLAHLDATAKARVLKAEKGKRALELHGMRVLRALDAAALAKKAKAPAAPKARRP